MIFCTSGFSNAIFLLLIRAIGCKPSKDNPYSVSDPNRSRHIKEPYDPPYITSTPEIFTHKLHYKNDKFLILATDGLWDELTPEEACIVVHDNMEKQGKESIVETNATVSNNLRMQ